MKINKNVRAERDRLERHWVTIFINNSVKSPRYRELQKEELEAFKKYRFYKNFLKAIK